MSRSTKGFAMIPYEMLLDLRISPSSIFVHAVLLWFAQGSGIVKGAKMAEIAKHSRISERALYRCLKELEEAGKVRRSNKQSPTLEIEILKGNEPAQLCLPSQSTLPPQSEYSASPVRVLCLPSQSTLPPQSELSDSILYRENLDKEREGSLSTENTQAERVQSEETKRASSNGFTEEVLLAEVVAVTKSEDIAYTFAGYIKVWLAIEDPLERATVSADILRAIGQFKERGRSPGGIFGYVESCLIGFKADRARAASNAASANGNRQTSPPNYPQRQTKAERDAEVSAARKAALKTMNWEKLYPSKEETS